MKRPLHVLTLMFLTTSLALVGCGDSENKSNGDGGVPTNEVGPALDTQAVDTVTPIDVAKPDVPYTVDTHAVDVNAPIDAPAVDAPALDAPAIDTPASHDTGAVEVDRTIDTRRADSGPRG